VLHWGERTLRHNAIRDVVHVWIDRAGLNPEKERPDLLPRRDGVSFSSNEETCQHAAAAYADLKPAHAETLAAFVAAREGAAVADPYSRLLRIVHHHAPVPGTSSPATTDRNHQSDAANFQGVKPSCSKDELSIWMSRLRAGT